MENVELRETIDLAISGDGSAFDRLVDGYRDMAFGYAKSLTGDREAAEDGVQEALVIAHRNLGRLADSEAFVAWLRGIVRHRCLRRPPRKHSPLSDAEEVASLHQSAGLDPLESELLIKAVARLPEAQRIALSLHYQDDLSQAEIAARLGVSKCTVNMRLHAARERLRRRLFMLNETTGRTSAIGRVEGAVGPLISLRFAPNAVPFIFARLMSDREELCVVRALPDGSVQAIPTRSGGIWTPGREVIDTGEPFLDALPGSPVEEIVKHLQPPGAFLRTGIKSVDIFAPLATGGCTGVFAEWGVGTLVLVPELVRRLEGAKARHTFLAFMPPLRDAIQWREVNAEVTVGTRRLEVMYLPVEDPLSAGFREKLSNLHTNLILSRRLAEQGIWPCVDPLRSFSRVLPSSWSGIAEDARTLIRRYFELQYSAEEASHRLTDNEWTTVRRARLAIRFLSQPFFVAEPFTKRPGVDADPDVAAQTFADIIAGRCDDRNKEDFMMIGAVPA
jgi:RNA polymerase sigma factor (sigma-70 family)